MGLSFAFQCYLKRFYRQGRRFQKYLKQLESSWTYSREGIEQYQNAQLRRIVRHCYGCVPYYQDLFRRLNLAPEQIQSKGDLAKLPFLDKQTVKANQDKLVAKTHKNFLCQVGATSGSTGSPGKFYRDYEAINFENAALWRHWHNAGDLGKKRVTLRGDIVVPTSQCSPPFWRYNPANRELIISGYHMALRNSRTYVDKIVDFAPSILYCYPSTAYLLAEFFRGHNVKYQFDAIFSSSESLDDDVRSFIEGAFSTRIYDWYGQAERVAAVGQCWAGTYHIQEDYSLVETIPSEDGVELVGTHLFNRVMPLLRYRTNDHVYLGTKSCACGCAFRTVEKIIGRTYGYLITPEGYRISITNHIPRGVENLIETQFYQERVGAVVVKVVTNGHFTEADRALLIKNTIEHTSPQMKVTVVEVEQIPRGPNGKFLSVINTAESVKV